jgi:hypothetical protein
VEVAAEIRDRFVVQSRSVDRIAGGDKAIESVIGKVRVSHLVSSCVQVLQPLHPGHARFHYAAAVRDPRSTCHAAQGSSVVPARHPPLIVLDGYNMTW